MSETKTPLAVGRGHSVDVSYLAVCKARTSAEIKAFFREKASLIFTLAFPVMLLILFGSIFGGDNQVVKGVRFVDYFVPGMIAAGVLASCFQNLAITIPIERDSGLLKRLRGTPMPKSAYFVGKIALVILLSFIQVILMLIVGLIFFGISLPASANQWLVFLGVFLLGIATCTLLGIAFSSVPKNGESGPAIVTPIALLLQFISGVFIAFMALPLWLQQVGAVFPLKWMAQGMRYAFLPDQAKLAEAGHQWYLGRGWLILGIWLVVGLVLCVTTFRWRTKADG